MIDRIRRGAVLASAALAISALTLSPVAAEETTSTVAASAFRQASQDPFTGEWTVSIAADAPWPATSTSTGTAYNGRWGMGGIYGWLVEFPLPSRIGCTAAAATLSIRPVDQQLYGPFPPEDPPFSGQAVALYASNGNPTGAQFRAGIVESRVITPPDDSPVQLEFDESVPALISQGSPYVGVRLTGANGVTTWDAPMDQPATRPSLTVTCADIGPDDDHDGVANADDFCPKTVLPDKITSLSKVKYAANSSGVFRSGAGALSGLSLDHTAGCSAIQIGQRLGPVVELDVRLWGLALNKLQKWADTH